MALSSDVEYLNSRDATIMGSRNGHAPIYLWYTLTRKGYDGMRKDVEKCMRNAHVLKVGGGGGGAGCQGGWKGWKGGGGVFKILVSFLILHTLHPNPGHQDGADTSTRTH